MLSHTHVVINGRRVPLRPLQDLSPSAFSFGWPVDRRMLMLAEAQLKEMWRREAAGLPPIPTTLTTPPRRLPLIPARRTPTTGGTPFLIVNSKRLPSSSAAKSIPSHSKAVASLGDSQIVHLRPLLLSQIFSSPSTASPSTSRAKLPLSAQLELLRASAADRSSVSALVNLPNAREPTHAHSVTPPPAPVPAPAGRREYPSRDELSVDVDVDELAPLRAGTAASTQVNSAQLPHILAPIAHANQAPSPPAAAAATMVCIFRCC